MARPIGSTTRGAHTSLAVIGIPLDVHSSFLRGAAKAPAAIREAFHSPSANYATESGVDLGDSRLVFDAGDLALMGLDPEPARQDGGAVFAAITAAIGELRAAGLKPIGLGGDHSIAFPILQAFGDVRPTVLQFDAHPDLYEEFDGSRVSHACPFARVMERGLVSRLVQVGIRTMTAHTRAQAARFGVETIEMREWTGSLPVRLSGPVYVSIDLDALDPAFAPGVSHHEPGGLSTREIIRVLQTLGAPIVGGDIVELNPDRDVNQVTAMTAAKLLKELAAAMLTR